MHKMISTLLALFMMLTVLPMEALAVENGANSEGLGKINTYSGQFSDVSSLSWYAQYVQIAYEYGLMNGISGTEFSPDGNLAVAEALAIACRLHGLCTGNSTSFSSGNPWYQPYVDYALGYNIIKADDTYVFTDPVTRVDFALFISNALPDEVLPAINDISFPDIPDLYSDSPLREVQAALKDIGVQSKMLWAVNERAMLESRSKAGHSGDALSSSAVYRLYNAGLLTGNDEYGTFTPSANITRSAVAAIVSRAVEPSLRQHITLTPKPKTLVPLDQLDNLSSLQRKASRDELAQAYEAARKIVEPFANMDPITQICGVTIAVEDMYYKNVSYSMTEAHYSDPYGFFILNVASCAGCTRALGLCLNMLGIPYEHVNENQYSHQWARVNVDGTYWVCDAQDLHFVPEEVPYEYPKWSF